MTVLSELKVRELHGQMKALKIPRNGRELKPELVDKILEERARLGNITKKCPQCGLAVVGNGFVTERFGFREVNGRTVPQSWCRLCKNAAGKESKQTQ